MVLATSHPLTLLPGPSPKGLVMGPSCSTACASVTGDSCVVEPAYADAYGKTAHPQSDGGDGGSDGPDAAQYGCPDYADAGTVTITCYASFPYQSTGCPL